MKDNNLTEIDINYNLIFSTDIEPQFYDSKNQELIYYWTDKKRVYWKERIIKNADIESFIVYNRLFAKDKNRCYLQGTSIQNSNPKKFTSLNNCYAKDENYVWTTGGIIKNIDSETFEVCDDGIQKPISIIKKEFKDNSFKTVKLKIPYGYAKDKDNVYYENYQGKTKVLKKANSETFRSLNNGYYGLDNSFVFYGQNIIQKANPKTWKLIDFENNKWFSKDEKSVFYTNKIIKGADVETFELYKAKGKGGYVEYFGKDKNNFYNNTETIDLSEIELLVNE
ncbi:DKNYY domain-containing protein [Algibacter sp. L3A6]|uniref:DKNYY domain-containing protein n=1 Tax=Algibacter sp. L3A6 TaxID=2686366 RepID=UPI00131BFD8C|nr:DKNYY domain-containing protein [Algibacter sp. L3A6]